MKNPFKHNNEPEAETRTWRPRQKQTLANVSEKILIRQMKKDPDYGLKAAERLKGVVREDKKTVADQLREYKELKALLSEFSTGVDGGGKSVLAQLLEMAPVIMQNLPQILASVKPDSSQQVLKQPQAQQSLPEAKPASQQLNEEVVNINDLLPYLDLEPAKVIEQLKANGKDGWLRFLKQTPYEKIIEMLTPWTKHPEFGTLVQQMISDKADWLKELVELAHESPIKKV